ncbi:hypothetical protein CYMTET_56070 [Cymbomonas tetramitiformis]|uniref:Thioredoxin domain-containing protein n=1 Tax=Cymbomonas tetramitiformis TaxID=36881 RepID=A0AAE0BCV9_9CHLO|nr:hypothetical protein CYMTET_56070 [Cymbomonas tetramitiformis]
MLRKYAVIAATILLFSAVQAEDELLSSKVDWKSKVSDLEGIDFTTNTKPIMVLITKSWCGACKRLKAEFLSGNGEADEIYEYSQKFHMMSFVDDQEPKGEQWTEDGAYVPRLFFLSPQGDVMHSIINSQGNPKYKYFYMHLTQVKASMRKALRMFNLKVDL